MPKNPAGKVPRERNSQKAKGIVKEIQKVDENAKADQNNLEAPEIQPK
jgi:hypothetical protein